MQQRRVRLGDVLDDYCPRERRITNHAVVAMIEDEVKRTRCATCDAEHEYKEAKLPAPRRKKSAGILSLDVPEGTIRPRPPAATAETPLDDMEETPLDDLEPSIPDEPEQAPLLADAAPDPVEDDPRSDDEDDGGHDWGHRPLIRATLPRPEGQTPERKPTDFTMRQPQGRFNNGRNNQRGGRRPGQPGGMRQAQGQRQNPGQGQGGQRHGSGQPPRHGSGQGPRHGSGQGNRAGSAHPQRGGGRPPGANRGGRKRGR
jgi:hypothetical protein